jgi:hypothetical protein
LSAPEPVRLSADAAGLTRLATMARTAGSRPVVLVDGRSGAGKTTLAAALAPLLSARVVSLDVLCPGWGGLEAGSRAVHETVLREHRPGYREWDWQLSAPAAWHALDPVQPLVIEGCGTLTRTNRALASLGVWVERDPVERKSLALARDPETFPPHWDDWAAQEEALIARERSPELADALVVPGGPAKAR